MYYRSLFSLVLGIALLLVRAQSDQSNIFGDSQCGQLMCVSGTVNGTETTYVLSGLGKQSFGWMAVGFGRQMSNTPMVIMWINSDNSVTLSQRRAPREVMPTVDPNPPRLATLSPELFTISTTTPQLAFTVPTSSESTEDIIFAYGIVRPSSSAVDASLLQHIDYGITRLDFTKRLPPTASGPSTGNIPLPTGAGGAGSSSLPLTSRERLIVAHAVFSVLGFLFFLPIGVLIARYLRLSKVKWFTGHWIVQFPFGGLAIAIGVILGITVVARGNGQHLTDEHKRWGIALLILYAVQCGIGAFIHFVKDPNRKKRPPQNYFHAVFGLTIIALALYQTHLGYDREWPTATGRGELPNGISIFFWIWVGVLITLYTVGLWFVPRQYRHEAQLYKKCPQEQYSLSDVGQ